MSAPRRFARYATLATFVVGIGTTGLATAAFAVPGNGNSAPAAVVTAPVVHGNSDGNNGNGVGNVAAPPATTAPSSVVTNSAVSSAAVSSTAPMTTAAPSANLSSSQTPSSHVVGNGGGANQPCGAYCPDPDGASLNGNGGGQATGRPCAGCVGNADSKNPPGQAPNGSDHNNGYECDGNHGIARTNPAHTGCETPTPSCVPTNSRPCNDCVSTETHPCNPCVATSEHPCTTPPGCEATHTCPVTPACIGAGCSPTVTPPPTPTPPVIPPTAVEALSGSRPVALPVTASTPAAVPTNVLGVSATRSALPFTGMDAMLGIRIALALLFFGAFVLWIGTRRQLGS